MQYRRTGRDPFATPGTVRSGAVTPLGIVANAESGRDIRRLVTGATVYDNAEKAAAIARLLVGAAMGGVEHVILMPTGSSLMAPLDRHLKQLRRTAPLPLPVIEVLDIPARYDAGDTISATREMVSRGCGAIVVLGGDGTHRLVASQCADTPILAMSTGTNNAFPSRHEETTAGHAAALVAIGSVKPSDACTRENAFTVTGTMWRETALVDVAVVNQPFVGSKAVWKADDLREVFVAFSDPAVVGLSSLASHFGEFPRGGEHGMRLQIGSLDTYGERVLAPLAPGYLAEVLVNEVDVIRLGESVIVPIDGCSIALDGERTIEGSVDSGVAVQLTHGPLTIDPRRCLSIAAARRLATRTGDSCYV